MPRSAADGFVLAKLERVDPESPVIGVKVSLVRDSFKSACKRAGLPSDLRWHDLRHSFATWLSTRCSFACLRDLLGHSPGSLVTLHYTHTPWEDRVEAIEKLADLFGEECAIQATGD